METRSDMKKLGSGVTAVLAIVMAAGLSSAVSAQTMDAALARAYGCWSETVTRTEEFAPALTRAMAETGVRLLHLKTDIKVITPATTLSRIAGR